MVDCAYKNNAELIHYATSKQNFYSLFEDEDLLSTCFCLFNNNLNVSQTAKDMYMHRNTLIYRLDKLKRLTGLDITTFSDAITFVAMYCAYCREDGAEGNRN